MQLYRFFSSALGKPGLSGPVCSLMSRIIVILLGVLVLSSALYAQPEGNLERLRQCAQTLADSAIGFYAEGDTVYLEVVPHPASWLLEQAVLTSAMARNIGVTSSAAERSRRLLLAITSVGIEYRHTDDADLLSRSCMLQLDASLATGDMRTGRSFSAVILDTVQADQSSMLEASGYDFARGRLPAEPGGGFWKTIVEPAVVLGASVVVAILLFTVRSQ